MPCYISDVPLSDEMRITARKDVLSRTLEGEAVLLDLESGTYFGLNEIASEIWVMMAKGTTVATIITLVLETYDVDEATARRDLELLLNRLQARGLVDVGPG